MAISKSAGTESSERQPAAIQNPSVMTKRFKIIVPRKGLSTKQSRIRIINTPAEPRVASTSLSIPIDHAGDTLRAQLTVLGVFDRFLSHSEQQRLAKGKVPDLVVVLKAAETVARTLLQKRGIDPDRTDIPPEQRDAESGAAQAVLLFASRIRKELEVVKKRTSAARVSEAARSAVHYGIVLGSLLEKIQKTYPHAGLVTEGKKSRQGREAGRMKAYKGDDDRQRVYQRWQTLYAEMSSPKLSTNAICINISKLCAEEGIVNNKTGKPFHPGSIARFIKSSISSKK